MDNETLKRDEIEALSAIYGDDLIIEDGDKKSISITLSPGELPDKTIKLDVVLSDDYPLAAPPIYIFSAPWMSGPSKKALSSDLEAIYADHAGESIIYMWIETAREYLDKVVEETDAIPSPEKKIIPLKDFPNTEAEKDDHDYEYQPEKFNHYHHYRKHHNNSDSETIIYHGEPIIDRRSTFQAHLSPVDCVEQVREVLASLKSNRKIASATHNISAYRISGGANHSFIQDCDDDGETHAGSRLLHLLQLLDVKNVLVVVSRWYGGVNLGADRFKHINNAARELLCKCNYVSTNSNSEKSSKHKSSKKDKSK